MATDLSKGTRAFEKHPLLQMNIKVIFQFVNRGGEGGYKLVIKNIEMV